MIGHIIILIHGKKREKVSLFSQHVFNIVLEVLHRVIGQEIKIYIYIYIHTYIKAKLSSCANNMVMLVILKKS